MRTPEHNRESERLEKNPDIGTCVLPTRSDFGEDRCGEARERSHAFATQIEDDDLVGAAVQPRGGHVKRLLRADLPETPEMMAVDPHRALVPAAQIEERVADLRHRELAVIERRSR